jgi:hypothetical protein
MSGPSTPRSCLARMAPETPTSPEQLAAMRQRAWLQQGVAVLPLDAIRDDWTRQAIINEAVRLHGKREGTR